MDLAGQSLLLEVDMVPAEAAEVERGPRCIDAAELFAVVVVWSTDGSSWSGWLTSTDRRSMEFSASAFADPTLLEWLSRLPGWDPARLAVAQQSRGIHLVWRSRSV